LTDESPGRDVGGVDSSVAAALLVEQVMTSSRDDKAVLFGDSVPDRPAAPRSITDAKLVAHKLAFRTTSSISRTGSGTNVIDNSWPSTRAADAIPCVRCNSFTKFRDFPLSCRRTRLRCDCDGHYAIADRGALFRAATAEGSVVLLWGIDRAVVRRCSRPSAISQEQTRTVARQLGLVDGGQEESVEICFVPDDNYVGCIEQHLRRCAGAGTRPLVTTSVR